MHYLKDKHRELVGLLAVALLCSSLSLWSQQQTAEDYLQSGFIKSDSGDNRAAIRDYDRAINLNPKSILKAWVYFARGVSKYELGDYNGAISDYDRAIPLNPQYAGAYHRRGLAKYSLKDYRGAISDYDRAIALSLEEDHEKAASYYQRGLAKYMLGDSHRARCDWKRAIELDPKYATAYYNL